jgi:hypothetical protein
MSRTLCGWLLPWLVGAGLTAGFWSPLLSGAGFLGGDVYNYFMPLKTYYAEGLKAGEIRFWHPKIGNGVSVLGESQTGVFFPAHLLAYRYLDVVPAYNAVFLLHTVLAFVFFVWLARHNGISLIGSLLGAGVFTFGWFAPRACLEWAATTGCWFPLEILLAQRWLETGKRRWGWLLSLILLVQLSAGHYQLAWVGMVGIGLFALIMMLWRARRRPASGYPGDRSCTQEARCEHRSSWGTPVADALGSLGRIFALVGFLLAGVLWSAPQLLPTWELKGLSKRSEAGFAEEVSYGRIPPKYLVQLVAPWVYLDPDGWLKWAGGDSNRIEAHFALGSVPLLLLVVGLFFRGLDARQRRWLLLALSGLLLATGLPFVVLKHVPGFSFFRYPGRYSLIAALFGSLVITAFLDRFFQKTSSRFIAAMIVGALAFAEFYWSSRAVGYVVMQNPPPLSRVKDSEILRRLTPQDRILAPDGNTLAVGPAAHVPPYIGLQPALYFELWNDVPDLFKGDVLATLKLIERLQQVGVTYILTREPLPDGWPVTLAWSGYDAFLHPRWGRSTKEPLWLYRFDASHGRMWVETPNGKKTTVAFSVGVDRFEATLPPLPNGGVLHTTEWSMPNFNRPPENWRAVHGDQVVQLNPDSSFLEPELARTDQPSKLTIQYQPVAFYRGLVIAAIAAALCLLIEWRLRIKRSA